jgi:hypothetical protein
MGTTRHRKLVWIVALLSAAGLGALAMMLAYGQWQRRHALHIGAIENVVLLPWNVSIAARVDTGAASSALDAREIKFLRGKKEVEFQLPERCGGHLVRRRVHAWRTVTSSDGKSEERPEVQMEFRFGDRRIRTHVTLTNRSHMRYPLLLGRRTLSNRFIVDVTQTNLLPSIDTTPASSPGTLGGH